MQYTKTKRPGPNHHAARIERAVAFLGDHIADGPSLEQLAGIAGVSPFHFHRLYRAVTGETPAATVRRLRLARACRLLADTSKSVTDIAFDAGYESSQAFAKAFRELAGTTATAARREPGRLQAVFEQLTATPGDERQPGQLFDVRLVSVEPFKVIAFRHTGPQEGLFGAYGQLWSWAERTGRVEGFRGIYGVPVDDPVTIDPRDCRFDCCFDFGPEATAEKEYSAQQLGGGLYAVVRHTGPYEGLDEKYDYLYGPWLAQSGRALDSRPAFNHYLSDPDALPPEQWETDIHLPLKP